MPFLALRSSGKRNLCCSSSGDAAHPLCAGETGPTCHYCLFDIQLDLAWKELFGALLASQEKGLSNPGHARVLEGTTHPKQHKHWACWAVSSLGNQMPKSLLPWIRSPEKDPTTSHHSLGIEPEQLLSHVVFWRVFPPFSLAAFTRALHLKLLCTSPSSCNAAQDVAY